MPYAFPYQQSMAQVTESAYYVFWMQNMPGRCNAIRYGTGEAIRNWWEFTADRDKAIRSGDGLHKPPQVGISVRPPSSPAGQVQWNLAGDGGFNWELQSSTNLQTWTVMQSLTAFGGELSISEPVAPGGRKYLRLVQRP